MAISFSVSLLLVALTTAATLLLISAVAPSQSQPPAAIQDKQLRNILDALIGSGDYGGWANLLSSANPSGLPLTATLFIPSNDAITRLLSAGAQLDPLLIPYHIVPQRLTFSDLRDLTTHTRLPTLLPSNFIVITNNSPVNFTVAGSQIMQPDIFLNAAFALHGVDKVLNYSVFGSDGPLSPPPMTPENASLLRKKKIRGIVVGARSGAWCCCARIPLILSSLLIFFTFKILGN